VSNPPKGEEVLYLPTIVEAAESSPAAAKECAQIIRKYLSKDNDVRPHVQYNGIMLVRILSDNPGPTFTRNIDKKFVDTVKELVKFGRDSSVRQILIETLQNFATQKQHDANLHPLTEMWKKEQAKMAKAYGSNVSYGYVNHITYLTNTNIGRASCSTNS
jgi:VHS domain